MVNRKTTGGRAGGRGGLDTKKRILKTALRLFSEQGFHRTTVRSIARDCGITDAAIYYHFPSKRSLLEALYHEAGFMDALDAIGRPVSQDSLRNHLVRAAEATADLFVHNADLLRVTLMGVLVGDWAAGALHWELRERWRKSFQDLMQRYADENRLRITDVARASETLVHMVLGAFLERVATTPRGRLRRAAESSFREHLVSVARDLGAIWEQGEVGPFRAAIQAEPVLNEENLSPSR